MTDNTIKNQDNDVRIEDLDPEAIKASHDLASVAATLGDYQEHTLTFREACKIYPTAIFWAMILSMTIIMEGYDQSLLGSLFAYPSFVRKYGAFNPETGRHEISSAWMAGLNNAAACGEVIGLLFNGFTTEKLGHRRMIACYLCFMAAFIFIVFFAPSIEVLCAGQVLLGVTWGGISVLGSTYASEVCPLALRGYLTAFVNVCWVTGQLVCNGVLDGLVGNDTQWSYRIPFAVQWAWILPLLVAVAFAPESPWWLIRKERTKDAERSMQRLSRLSPSQIQAQLQLMIRTDEHERETRITGGIGDCFKGTNLRRTEIAAVCLSAQSLCGAAFAYNASYFFVQAGLKPTDAYKLQLGGTGLALVCTFLSFYLLSIFGRRTLLLAGLGSIAIDLLIIGALATTNYPGALWAQTAFAVLWMGLYSSLLGPESFTMASEVSATRLRASTLSIAQNCHVIINLTNKVIEPYLINPTEANLKGKTALFWLGTVSLTFVWAMFRLPETRNRTYEELNILFENRVPAWRFATSDVSNRERND